MAERSEALNDPECIFEVKEQIGKGSYGSVVRATHRQSGRVVAIKIIPIESETDIFIKETQLMKKCNSEFIVKYFGSYVKNVDLWIIMEYCGAGSMSDLMKKGQYVIYEEEIRFIMAQILLGLDHLHSLNMIHRDIKAGNILLTDEGVAKLADFGVSIQLDNASAKRKTFIGTPFWMAPEVIKEEEYNSLADIWSLGITAIELAEGVPPYSTMHPMRAIFLIPNRPAPRLRNEQKWTHEFVDFVSSCLVKDPKHRPSAKELLKHPFVADLVPKLQSNKADFTIMKDMIKRLREKQATTKVIGPNILKPLQPAQPPAQQPAQQPAQPAQPVHPPQPSQPQQLQQPAQPAQPVHPPQPSQPSQPSQTKQGLPVHSPPPVPSVPPAAPAAPAAPTTPAVPSSQPSRLIQVSVGTPSSPKQAPAPLVRPGSPTPNSRSLATPTSAKPALHSPPLKPHVLTPVSNSASGSQTPKQWTQSSTPRMTSAPGAERTSPPIGSPRGSLSPPRNLPNMGVASVSGKSETMSSTGTMVVRDSAKISLMPTQGVELDRSGASAKPAQPQYPVNRGNTPTLLTTSATARSQSQPRTDFNLDMMVEALFPARETKQARFKPNESDKKSQARAALIKQFKEDVKLLINAYEREINNLYTQS